MSEANNKVLTKSGSHFIFCRKTKYIIIARLFHIAQQYFIIHVIISLVIEMQEKDFFIDINGTKQNILVLYEQLSNPILLIVHGGPGSPDRPLVRRNNSPLTKCFTVVCWDQRGAGLSYTVANTKD